MAIKKTAHPVILFIFLKFIDDEVVLLLVLFVNERDSAPMKGGAKIGINAA
jgi:hypothetical protein